MFRNHLPDSILEEERRFLVLWMQLPIYKYTPVEILLRSITEHLVLAHDAFVHVSNEMELFIRGGLVAVNLIGHLRDGGRGGHESLNHDEMASVTNQYTMARSRMEMCLRNRHGCVRKIICAMCVHASLDLVIRRRAVMLNVPVLEITIEAF
jgi:hypothetical protein